MNTIERTLLELRRAVRSSDSKTVAKASSQLVQLMESSLAERPEAFCRALQDCVDEFAFDRASELCGQLITHLRTRDRPYPTSSANRILTILQRKRLFSEMIAVADQLQQSGSNEPVIQRRYAQALIDSGHYSVAITMLMQLAQQCDSEGDTAELAEANGLLGRVYKQIYINATESRNQPGQLAKDALKKSFDYYHARYLLNPQTHHWHGINAVAVSHLAEKDKIKGLPDFDRSKTTAEILGLIDGADKTDMWTMATAAEACLAMDDYGSALRWLNKYVGDEYVKNGDSDAFEVASTLRQFEEVWRLTEEDTGQSSILQVLRAALLKRKGGVISLDSPQKGLATLEGILDNKVFEGIFGADHFQSLKWLKTGFERSQGVCKFIDQFDNAFGTGFLMKSERLNLPIPEQWVVLTNAHVISNDKMEQCGVPKARSPESVYVQFEAGMEPERKFQIDRILAWSSRHELDYSVLTLTEEGDFSNPYKIAPALPLLENNQRIYLIGHPRGGQLSFSLYDNELLDHEGAKVHYRSPSLGGSSGSPVFNEAWGLIGLHHAGGPDVRRLKGQPGTYEANEGICIKTIVSDIESKAS